MNNTTSLKWLILPIILPAFIAAAQMRNQDRK